MEHTRAALSKLIPAVAINFLYTNRRRPILRFAEDTSSGIHEATP